MRCGRSARVPRRSWSRSYAPARFRPAPSGPIPLSDDRRPRRDAIGRVGLPHSEDGAPVAAPMIGEVAADPLTRADAAIALVGAYGEDYGRILRANGQLAALLGVSAEELVGTRACRHVHPA